MSTEQSHTEITVNKTNPYTVALLTIGVAALLVAAMLAAYGSVQADAYGRDATVEFVWAGFLVKIGVGCGLLLLLVGAMTWKPSA